MPERPPPASVAYGGGSRSLGEGWTPQNVGGCINPTRVPVTRGPLRGTLRGVAGVATCRFKRVCYTVRSAVWQHKRRRLPHGARGGRRASHAGGTLAITAPAHGGRHGGRRGGRPDGRRHRLRRRDRHGGGKACHAPRRRQGLPSHFAVWQAAPPPPPGTPRENASADACGGPGGEPPCRGGRGGAASGGRHHF